MHGLQRANALNDFPSECNVKRESSPWGEGRKRSVTIVHLFESLFVTHAPGLNGAFTGVPQGDRRFFEMGTIPH